MKSSSIKNWGCLAAVAVLLLLPVASYMLMELRTSDGRKTLPSSAANIQEDLKHGLIGGDFARLLKADLPEECYNEYARSLGLSQRFDSQAHREIESILNIGVGGPDWWNPPAVDQTSYFDHVKGDDHLKVLRYHEGSVYYLMLRW